MSVEIDICSGCDTFAVVNGHRIRLGRNLTSVTADELSDIFARAFREMGATPLVMNERTESVFGIAERENGDVDTYQVYKVGSVIDAFCLCTITPDGEREYR